MKFAQMSFSETKVSGAAGATGLVACHTFRHLGCRVIGSAGTPEKAMKKGEYKEQLVGMTSTRTSLNDEKGCERERPCVR